MFRVWFEQYYDHPTSRGTPEKINHVQPTVGLE